MTVGAYRDVDSKWDLHFLSAIEGVNLSQNKLPYVFAARRTVGQFCNRAGVSESQG